MRWRMLILGCAMFAVAGAATAAEGLFEQETLSGDWGGVRKEWQDAGVELGATNISEMLSNVMGGIRQTTIYQGLLTLSLNIDLEKRAHWPGATFYVDAYQISGRGLTRNAVGNLLTVSTIEALPSTRLHDLWLQQRFAGGLVSLRAGQIALDDEFYISQYAANFVNSTFGCPDILAVDLPSGGPCYPFATPGARLWAVPAAGLSLSAAAFNGNPAPPGPGDPQVRDPSGTNFLIGEGGWLLLAELAYQFDKPPNASDALSNVKLGGWYHSANFADQRLDTLGRSLADPLSSGVPGMRRGNFGLYVVADKMLWQPPGATTEGLAGFLRISGVPPDRNLVSLEIDAGLTYRGLFPGRGLDLLGIAVSYARIGSSSRRFDRELILFTGVERPVRNYETVLEITYQAPLAPWWVLQPDLQLIFHPGGNSPNPAAAPALPPIPNALVLGLRSTITF